MTTSNNFPPMRSRDEVQKMHDILIAVVLGEVPVRFPADVIERMNYSCDVLCWVLQHDHNDSFEKNVAEMMEEFERLGIIFLKEGEGE